ncbi:hypothetical protein [Thermopetrobacter sp. TC1]|uniref:hypothetical protein n=1 Tax=Thermopetrobacter sp. TC1 TaxID=1495045 RepID=UPI00056DC886|nr:hypothetical protein [Thermopetrobacter sp. TC1]
MGCVIMTDMATCMRVHSAAPHPALVLAADGDVQAAGRLCALLERLGMPALALADAEAALVHCRRDMPRVLLVSAGRNSADEAERFIARLQRLSHVEASVIIACLKDRDPALATALIMAGAHDCLCAPLDSETLAWKLRLAGLETE